MSDKRKPIQIYFEEKEYRAIDKLKVFLGQKSIAKTIRALVNFFSSLTIKDVKKNIDDK